MSLIFRKSRTAIGKPELVVQDKCDWQEFPIRAQAIVDRFGMSVLEKTDGLDERMWITCIGDARFCISWDTWFSELTVMAWERTLDLEISRLIDGEQTSWLQA